MPASERADAGGVRRLGPLRATGFALALILGGVGVWLIVTSASRKPMEIGVLAGLWGLLIGTFAVFGARHPQHAPPRAELELRARSELERADEAAARRHHEARLEAMLRHEIQQTLGPELAALRAEVEALRTELVDKVGGQLRLERIETTRVIGSDIEALQREVHQLKLGHRLSEPTQPLTFDRPREIEAETVIRTVSVPAPPDVPAPPVVSAPPALSAPQPPASAAPPGSTERPAPAPPRLRPPSDGLADLPRLRPFTDFELDVVDSLPANGHGGHRGTAGPSGAAAAGGRRRRESGDDNDLLARILNREGAQH